MARLSAFRRLAARNADLADFLLVYIEEAHPSDGWASSDAPFSIPRHRCLQDRLSAARLLQEQQQAARQDSRDAPSRGKQSPQGDNRAPHLTVQETHRDHQVPHLMKQGPHQEHQVPPSMMQQQQQQQQNCIALAVDTMDNASSAAYGAYFERLYVVQEQRVMYQGGRGPDGYKISELHRWLDQYRGRLLQGAPPSTVVVQV